MMDYNRSSVTFTFYDWWSESIFKIKNRQNLPISNPKADLHYIDAYTKFEDNSLIFTKVIVQLSKYRHVTDR